MKPSPREIKHSVRQRVIEVQPIGGGVVRLRLSCGHLVKRKDSYHVRKMANCDVCGGTKNLEYQDS